MFLVYLKIINLFRCFMLIIFVLIIIGSLHDSYPNDDTESKYSKRLCDINY